MKPLQSLQAPQAAPVVRSSRNGAFLAIPLVLAALVVGVGSGAFLLHGSLLRTPEPALVVALEARLTSRGMKVNGHAGRVHDSDVDLDAGFHHEDSGDPSAFRLRRFKTPGLAHAQHCFEQCIVNGRLHLQFVEWPAAERPKVRDAFLTLPQ
jgi:hypothetical protein